MRQDVVAGPPQFLPWSILTEAPRGEAAFDNTQALAEGWMIVRSANRHQPWQLQRVDQVKTFGTDVEAWCYVFDQADQGSAYHQQAIFFLEQHIRQQVA